MLSQEYPSHLDSGSWWDVVENQDVKEQPANVLVSHKAPEFDICLIASKQFAILK